jgi:hypothetical protein
VRHNQNNEQKSIPHKALVVLAAFALSMAVMTDAMAARFGGSGGGHGDSGFGAGQISRGFRGPLPESIPSTPSPVFNPSEPYALPETPEIPVSPASPGSIFGNG